MTRCRYCHYILKLLYKYCSKYLNFTSTIGFDDMSGATLTLNIGDNTHFAVATNKNLDGSDAQNVNISFTSDDPSICSVDGTTGALTPLAGGTTNIVEKSTRLAFLHTDSGAVTVLDPNTGDFTTEETFT